MLVLGAGGAAQAALAVALLEHGDVRLAVRHVAAARAVLDAFWQRAHAAQPQQPPEDQHTRVISLSDERALANVLTQTDILINATPVGTGDPEASPLDTTLLRQLPPSAFVFDMVYNPPETALVRAARSAGRRATGGLLMLLYQGAEAFTLWTHTDAPLEVMRHALGL
jgi:shikimate dehydrogenase